MKSIMAIVFGLLLLSPAVDAEGISNIANVALTENMDGQVMTNANFAQASNIEANLDGNSIYADQISNIEAIDNILVGSKPDGETFFYQSVDQSINDTGNNNLDTQNVGAPASIGMADELSVDNSGSFKSGLIAFDNTLTNSGFSQAIGQSETVNGNSNTATQNIGVLGSIGPEQLSEADITQDNIDSGINEASIDQTNEAEITQDNIDSGINEASINQADEASITYDNINSGTNEASIDLTIEFTGDVNTDNTNSFNSGLIAFDNTLTNSGFSQAIGQSETVNGNSNTATQNIGVLGSIGPELVNEAEITQENINSGINEASIDQANEANITQDNTNSGTNDASIDQTNEADITQGNTNSGTNDASIDLTIEFTGDVNTDNTNSFNSGLIAFDNTLTNSGFSQAIGQSEMVNGNSNTATQNIGVLGSIGPELVNEAEITQDNINSGINDASVYQANEANITQDNTNSGTNDASIDQTNEADITQENINSGVNEASIDLTNEFTGDVNTDNTNSFNSGLIAFDNTLTNSGFSQAIGQSETVNGNSNTATQNIGVLGSIGPEQLSEADITQENINSGINEASIDQTNDAEITQDNTHSGINDASIEQTNEADITQGNTNSGTNEASIDLNIEFTGDVNTDNTNSFNSGLIAFDNTLTNSGFSQAIGQSETVNGNSNTATQNVGVLGSIGPEQLSEAEITQENINSGINEASVDQANDAEITEWSTNNGINEASIYGTADEADIPQENINGGTKEDPIVMNLLDQTDVNTGDTNSFNSGLIASCNTLTDSFAVQAISQGEMIDGNSNEATQNGNSVMTADILTRSNALQVIDEDALTVGNFNTILHDGKLTSAANTVTDGSILQRTDIFSSN